MSETEYDLLIIGAGINGAGIARDAAGRGWKVLLCEKDDLAAHTSSSSTKLIHGGLRYLEYYDFWLVRKALKEREVLLRAAPHIIWPMRFVLPYQRGNRPAWLIRLGLFVYDHLGGRKLLPPTKVLRRKQSDKFAPLKKTYKLAFEYSDCWVEDARLVVLNAMDAASNGATILTQTPCTNLERYKDYWQAKLTPSDGPAQHIKAKLVINAAGPWVDEIAGFSALRKTVSKVRRVKGSHIILPKLYEGDHAFFFQNRDGRIIFAIPYENGTMTLIGTTDIPYTGDLNKVEISPEETDYLCAAASEYFKKPVRAEDIIATYSGVRPLYDDQASHASEVTRDYMLILQKGEQNDKRAPMLSIYGGKITTYRKLAEGALELIEQTLGPKGKPWTRKAPLPGGNIPKADFNRFVQDMAVKYPWLDIALLYRLLRAYGTRIDTLLKGAASVSDLGPLYGAGLYQREVDYLIAHEFARTADDILKRRSKLALHMSENEIAELERWFATRFAP